MKVMEKDGLELVQDRYLPTPLGQPGCIGLSALQPDFLIYQLAVGDILSQDDPGDFQVATCQRISISADVPCRRSAQATATSQAEFEWDGDASRGVGDYRIPVALKQNSDGSQITASEKFPNKGIVRDDSCSLVTPWRAWKCTSLRHRMMIIESMDSDTEIRRLSPIALIANPGTSGYVDLLNGPMDQGWCFGYTCQERISTFYSIIASGYTYEVAMTSTPPQVIRFHLLHSDPTETVLLRLFFPKMQRYDIYVDDALVQPTNIDTSATSYKLLPEDPNNPEAFFPTHSDPVGSNYLQRSRKMLHVLLRGGHIVQIKTRPMVVLSTGAVVSEEDFYEENLVANVAAMLGISAENIVVTNIVRESRRRQAGSVSFTADFEVSSAPTSSPNSTDGAASGQVLNYDDLVHSVANLVNEFQTECKNCSFSLSSLQVEDPVPPPEEAGEPATEEAGSVIVENGELFSDIKQKEENAKLNQSLQASTYEEPSGTTIEEGVPADNVAFTTFSVQPILSVQSSDGSNIQDLGYSSNPWLFEAVLRGGPRGATLMGNTVVPYVDGFANFTDLSVNQAGEGYSLSFVVAYPDSVTVLNNRLNYTFSASPKPVSLRIVSQPRIVNANTDFFLDLAIYDDDINRPIDPSLLVGQSLTGNVIKVNKRKPGELTGDTSFTLNDGDISQFTVGPLQITDAGMNYKLKAAVNVSPTGWRLRKTTGGINVMPQDWVISDDIMLARLSMKGLMAKGKVARGSNEEFITKLNNAMNKKVGGAYYFDYKIRRDRKLIAFLKAMGSTEQVETALQTLCNALKIKDINIILDGQKITMVGLRVNGKHRRECNA
ncbi:fibrocystin-L-like [Palaemon carinicauda]|uniref:fibrocystin-L-like n=1 Tax=Palaemon carinicauda TaxID=392227 RepID=UPI0035B63B6D